MICGICGKEFEAKHFNQKYCCEECKTEAKRAVKRKYKASEKGKASNERWVNSDKRKENEKRYRQNPVVKHKAVLRAQKYLDTHEEALEKKRERDREFAKTPRGRELNRKATAKYRQTDKGRFSQRVHRYENRSIGQIDREYLRELLNGDTCYYCGRTITGKKTIDHKIPTRKGGTNENSNLVLCCLSCNCKKNDRTESEYKEVLLNGTL
ncbi:MAG: HNH endonuclease [Anaeroplasma bactoclasticum]|nr:HNH endonuclease [Anaeroplasma bactoclasticum]